jgi:predicted nucleic-acid-binding protein
MTKYLLDTNYLARFLIKDNDKQLQIILDLIKKSTVENFDLICDTSTIFELVYVLTGKIYGLSRQEVSLKISELIDLDCFIFLEKIILEQTFNIFESENLDIVDCYLIAKSLHNGFIFTSFDIKANKIYEKLKNQPL